MKQDHTYHHKNQNSEDRSSELFARVSIPWEKSKDEVWKDLKTQLQEEGSKQGTIMRFLPGKQWLALAATIALLIAVGGIMRIHSVATVAPVGEHVNIQLPDGSLVE
ncbi:MAG: hypothetical protein KAT15_17620, partial [Bacteroidales bacterium]|nr:hypothetical protein [Bacteroidales bacterium]